MNKGLASGLVLLTLGLGCGLLLAGVNAFTAPTILANENQVKYDAISEFYDLANYTILEESVDGGLVDTLFYLSDTGGTLQAIVYSVKQYGYQSNVKMLIAISSDLSVDGYKVVEQAETAGLGSLSVTYDFNMDGVIIPDLSAFDSISGATITSNAVKACFSAVFERAASDFGGGM